jgi:RNA polymerase sigma factor (sigma-70 family)
VIEPSDEKITGAEEARFESLYRAHVDHVARYVFRRYVGDTNDVVSEVFLIAWEKFNSLPIAVEEQRWWLFATARRVIANRVRWRARHDRFSMLARPLTTDSAAHMSDEDAIVHLALGDLREADRELLLLVEWEGLSVDGAASVLGLPVSTVTQRLRAARERFKRLYLRWSAPVAG